jgi:hypothetical protein
VPEAESSEQPPSRVLREGYARDYLVPLARALFELEPRCQSMLVTVGQYWCDEAADAVHCHQVACLERDPEWPEAGKVRPGVIGDLHDTEDGWSLDEAQWPLFEKASLQAFGKAFASPLDDNTDMIVAFASYCKEVSSQEEPSWVSHTPYGIVRRPTNGEEPSLEVLGQMHRPEWEDRWDVLEHDGLITESTAEVGAMVDTKPLPEQPTPKPTASRFEHGRVVWFLAAVAAIVAYRYFKK